jgi:glycosyltransferase involved in cell wall biosynthesis
MLEGYPHRFLKTPSGAAPVTFLRSRFAESLPELLRKTGTTVVWVQGWQVAAYWQAVWLAHRTGLQVWLRGESKAMGRKAVWKRAIKQPLLDSVVRRVDHLLCIGTANRDLYRSHGVPEEKLHLAPYAVDNERFELQAEAIRGQRSEIRDQWRIPKDAHVVLFCGKFIPKKRPLDLINAAQLFLRSHPDLKVHLLFVGSGELGGQLRAHCQVIFDADSPGPQFSAPRPNAPDSVLSAPRPSLPPASFVGFLNQTEISKAYVAADALVLPSDYSETWGLVVNEAMASGLPCIISNRCGSAPDLGDCAGNAVFSCGNVVALAERMAETALRKITPRQPPTLHETAAAVRALYLGK